MPNKPGRNAEFDSEPDMIVPGPGQCPDLEKYIYCDSEATYSRFRCFPCGDQVRVGSCLPVDEPELRGGSAAQGVTFERTCDVTRNTWYGFDCARNGNCCPWLTVQPADFRDQSSG